jgi:hypothetical protein
MACVGVPVGWRVRMLPAVKNQQAAPLQKRRQEEDAHHGIEEERLRQIE